MKKRYFLGLPALMLALVLLGCPNNPEEEDTWSPVTSLSQMNGTWKGSYSETQDIEELFSEFGGGSQDQSFGDIKVTMSAEMTIIFNASAKTQAGSMKITMKLSGSNVSSVYQMLKGLMQMNPEGDYGFNDSNYSITMSEDLKTEAIPEEELAQMLSQFQINQNGKKLKILEVKEDDRPEMIMVKQ
jgi:hypothetical protein